MSEWLPMIALVSIVFMLAIYFAPTISKTD